MDQIFYLAIMSSIEKEVLLNLGSSMYWVRLDICLGTSGGNMKVVERSVGKCLVYPVPCKVPVPGAFWVRVRVCFRSTHAS